MGDWVHLPSQTANTGAHFATDEGEMASWMVKAIDGQEEPWWFHTHPDMPAFMSYGDAAGYNDLRGAHELWDMIRKPFRMIIAGQKNQRVDMRITERWIKKNLLPPAPPMPKIFRPVNQHLVRGSTIIHGQGPIIQYPQNQPANATQIGLENEVRYMIQKWGAQLVYEAMDQIVYQTYVDRDPNAQRFHDAWR